MASEEDYTTTSSNNDLKRKGDTNEDEEDEIIPPAKVIKVTLESGTIPATIIGNNKVDQEVNTEEEYVTDIEKTLKCYHDNYKEQELEEYKQMLQQFYNQNLRLATRCQKLKAAAEKSQNSTTKILKDVSKLVNPSQLAFITSQLVNGGKLSKKRVWSPQFKNMIVGLYQTSPKGYWFLKQMLILPEEEEVKNWISHGVECDIKLPSTSAKESAKEIDIVNMEAQAVLDAITFENLMATLL